MKNTILSQPEYLKCVHPKEQVYYTASAFISVIFWIIIVIGTFGVGLFYVLFFSIVVIIGHAVFLSYIRGYGIKISEKQFPEIDMSIKETAKKLGLHEIPDVYIYNMDGIFNAFATHFFSRNFIILTTAILDACSEDKKKIEFIVAHEMIHLQRGHTRNQFFLFPSRIIPWLGNAYSRACEYTCDGVAGKYILDDKKEAIESILLLPTADSKRASRVDLDAYEDQRSESGSFWMTLVQTGSTHPYSFNRVAHLRSLFGDDIKSVPQSFFGMLLSPFFSLGGGSGASILVVIAIIGILAAALFPALSAYLERSRNSADKYDSEGSYLYEDYDDLSISGEAMWSE